MHALKCCINEASLCFCHGAVFIRLFSEEQSSKLSSTEKTKNKDFTFSKDKTKLDCHRGAADQETVHTEWTYAIEIHRR